MENAHEHLCQEKFKRIDPIVKFLSNMTKAEKKQVKKDITNFTFDPDHSQAHEHLDTVRSTNSAAMPLSPGTAVKIGLKPENRST